MSTRRNLQLIGRSMGDFGSIASFPVFADKLIFCVFVRVSTQVNNNCDDSVIR